MPDKRGFRRVPEQVDIQFRIISLGDNPGEYIDLRGGGHTENISEGGMLFEVDELIPLGTFLEIQFNVKGVEYPAYLRGRVVRVEEILEDERYDIGVMFTHYFEKDREMMQTHLKEIADKIFKGK